jgi:hypothetical protein
MILPTGISFESWARSLIIDFPTDNIPIYSDGHDWKSWGNLISQQPNFSNNGAPTTQGFDDKMAWAMATYRQMNNFA